MKELPLYKLATKLSRNGLLHTNIILLVYFVFQTSTIYSQTSSGGDNIALNMPQVALIDTDHAPIVLTLTTSTAGESIAASDSNSDMWMKLTSIVPASSLRDVTAKIVGTVPAGTVLTLSSASATTTNGSGIFGTPVASPITLSTTDQNLISNIGSCFTGTGSLDGFQLTYTWALDNPSVNFGVLVADPSASVTVYLTLTEAN